VLDNLTWKKGLSAPFNYTNMNDNFVPIFEQVKLLEWNFVDLLYDCWRHRKWLLIIIFLGKILANCRLVAYNTACTIPSWEILCLCFNPTQLDFNLTKLTYQTLNPGPRELISNIYYKSFSFKTKFLHLPIDQCIGGHTPSSVLIRDVRRGT
jgi:hypothetical protein